MNPSCCKTMAPLLRANVLLLFWCKLVLLVVKSVETKNTSQGFVKLESSIKERSACPGEEITLTCTIQKATSLTWSWGNTIVVKNRTIFTNANNINGSCVTLNQVFTGKLTKVNGDIGGTANFESTLTFKALNHLNGTTVNCSNSTYNASFAIHILHVVALPQPSIIHQELIPVNSNYSVYVVEWAAVPEAESYEVNVTGVDVNEWSTSEITSMTTSSFIVSSTDTIVNFSIRARASQCLGHGYAYVQNVDLSQLDNASMSDPEMSGSFPLIPILSTVCGVFGGVLGTLTIVFIVTKLLKLKSKGLKVKQHSKESPGSGFIPTPNKVDDTEPYSEVRDSSGNWNTCRGQTAMTSKSSEDTDTYSRPRDYIRWTQLHTTTTTSALHGQPNYEGIDCTGEPQKNFRLISSRCEEQEIPMYQTQSDVFTASGDACTNNAFKQDEATTDEGKSGKQEFEMNHRLLSSRYEMQELPGLRILEHSCEPQAVGSGYTEEQKRRPYSDLSRNSMYFSLEPCVQKRPPAVPPEPTSENSYSSLHHGY